MNVKAADIASRLSLSKATVSLVLNNKPGVSEKTRQRVLETLCEMGGETPDMRRLAATHSIRLVVYRRHGLIVEDTPFFSTLLQGCESEARRRGYNLLISYMTRQEAERSAIQTASGVDGQLLLATEMFEDDLSLFRPFTIPTLLLDNYFIGQNLQTVTINNQQGAYLATQHLIASGHRKIGILTSSTRAYNFEQREQGYRMALMQAGIQPLEQYCFMLDSTIETAYRRMSKLLQEKRPLPSAFFAANDMIGFGAMRALREAGLCVPKDISLVGFDDMPMCEVVDPPMDTVAVPKREMGMQAVSRLIEQIETQGKREEAEVIYKLEVGTRLMKRSSVRTVED